MTKQEQEYLEHLLSEDYEAFKLDSYEDLYILQEEIYE